jgi:kinesin family protein 4/21/27
MGTSFDPNLLPEEEGIIPRAIAYLFRKIQQIVEDMRKNHIQEDFIPKFNITAQFMELYNEEVIDLFDQTNTFTILSNATNGVNLSSTSNTKKIEIHEDQFGTIHVQGCSVRQVNSINEVSFLF